MITGQAQHKGTKIARRVGGHMMPESQSLPSGKTKKEVACSSDDPIRDTTLDLREDETIHNDNSEQASFFKYSAAPLLCSIHA